MPNPPLVFKTYQDVKNNLLYWTLILLVITTFIPYVFALTPAQRQLINDNITLLGSNPVVAAIAASLIVGAYFTIAAILVWGVQIHDAVYDSLIIGWRKRYDVEFIIARLTEPIKQELPKNFLDYARRYRPQFMKPYYEFVGDGKKGIEENTRIRFYERVTWYWVTQLNEIFILAFIIGTPAYILVFSSGSFSLNSFAKYMLALTVLGIINRWLIGLTRKATSEATSDEIEEVLFKKENVEVLRERYKQLCDTYKI